MSWQRLVDRISQREILALSPPPPFFHQGFSARLRLIVAAVAAVAVMQLDHAMNFTKPLRQGITLVLHPVTVALEWPAELVDRLVCSLKTVCG